MRASAKPSGFVVHVSALDATDVPSTASISGSASWGLSRSLTRTRPSEDASLRTTGRRELPGMRSDAMNLSLGSRDEQVGETAKERVRRRKEERLAVHRVAYEAELRDARIAAFNDFNAAKRRMEEDEHFETTVNDGEPGTWEIGWDLLADDKHLAMDPAVVVADADDSAAEEAAADVAGK